MTILRITTIPLWENLQCATQWIIQQRGRAETMLGEAERAGLNATIILNAACCIEGALECALMSAVNRNHKLIHSLRIEDFETRRGIFTFQNRIKQYLEHTIFRATGIDRLAELFAQITGKRLANIAGTAEQWEDISALFRFRNIIAHARMAMVIQRATSFSDDGADILDWEDDVKGSYRHVQSYLLRRGLIAQELGRALLGSDMADAEVMLFSNAIADHFLAVSEGFTDRLVDEARAAGYADWT